jgi:hypothetical protein
MKIVYCAKEAGGGALLAGLINVGDNNLRNIFIGGESALPYFSGSNIKTYSDKNTDLELEAILLSERPDKIITVAATGFSIDKRIYLLARKHEIPIFSYVDHYWNIWQRFADPVTIKKWAFMPDKIFLPDQKCIDRAIIHGAEKSRLFVYSNPLLMNVALKKETQNELILSKRRKYNVPADAIVALYISETLFQYDKNWEWDQPTMQDLSSLLQILLKISLKPINNNKRVIILVRAHPSEEKGVWDNVCKLYPDALWINASDIPKEDLLIISSMAFGLNSILLLEAAIGGIPSFSYHEIKTNSQMWLSTLRDEIIELNDQTQIIELFQQ